MRWLVPALGLLMTVPGCGTPTVAADAGVEICNNGKDDNGDGKTDCEDPQCFSSPFCLSGLEICNNGKDDNGDGLIDCADPECATFPGCSRAGGGSASGGGSTGGSSGGGSAGGSAGGGSAGGSTGGGSAGGSAGGSSTGGSAGGASAITENCSNGVDDNGDGAIDCGDTECASSALCSGQTDGARCTTDAQCSSGQCRSELGWGYPNGFCANATGCNVAQQTGCHGGTCLTGGTCAVPCTGTGLGATGGCRVGYACEDSDSNPATANNVCMPLCTADSECSDGGSAYGCNDWSKRCGAKNAGLAQYGAPCADYTQCESAQCFPGTDPNWPGGYCAGPCRGDLKSCAPNGYCTYDPASNANLGFCVESCATLGATCRAQGNVDYTCIVDSHDSAGEFCRCKAHSETCGSGPECCSGTCTSSACQ